MFRDLIQDYLLEIRHGRLGGLRFAYLFALTAMLQTVLTFTLIIVFDVLETEALIASAALFSYAELNIIAKRVRDVGLWGWPVSIAIAILFLFTTGVSQDTMVRGIVPGLVFLLALAPTDSLRRAE